MFHLATNFMDSPGIRVNICTNQPSSSLDDACHSRAQEFPNILRNLRVYHSVHKSPLLVLSQTNSVCHPILLEVRQKCKIVPVLI
jgi:hypothetical protein